jgi:hypothetical protein
MQRNRAIERIKEIGSKDGSPLRWKREIGYHKRSLVAYHPIETTMFRYKVIFGDKSQARITENQLGGTLQTEAKIKCKILNVFTNIGMPKTIKIF